MRQIWYNRFGQPIESMEAASLIDSDDRIIKQSRHKERGKEFWLSTVFLVIDHSFDGGPPVLWETMAFEFKKPAWNSVVGDQDWSEMSCRRYRSEEAARAGHDPWEMSA